MSADDASQVWVDAFVAGESAPDHVEAWVERTASAILAETPELTRDADLADLLRTTVRDQWLAFLATLSESAPEVTLVPSATALAAELARRHLDLPVLLSAYRIAQRESWAYAIGVVEQAPADVDRTGLLVDFWSRAGQWLDRVSEASILVHQEERRRVRHSGTAQRFEVVRAVLAGEEPESRDLAAALGGYPVSATHTALVLRATTPEATSQLEPLAHTLAARLSPGRPLLVEPGGRELWVWVPAANPAALRQAPASPGLLVAAGGPGEGVSGFAVAHEEAATALRVALALPDPAPVTLYDEVAALALLARDPVAAERFTRRMLGGLAEDSSAAARMRETLRVVLAHPGRTEEAAAELSIHKNTVRYRVGQAERMLGHPAHERASDLDLALRYYAAFLERPETTLTRPSR